ncbi:MAG: ATP-binding protein [Chloroflexota bacterium]
MDAYTMVEMNLTWLDVNALWGQTSAAILSLSESGEILTANPAAIALFGCGLSELIGKPLFDFVDAYSRDKALAMLSQADSSGSAQNWELDILTAEGAPRLVSFSVDRFDVDLPALGRYVLVCSDLSVQLNQSASLAKMNQELEGALLELEKVHKSLKETQLQLVQSEKMRSLGQLVSGVAHEINNPLGFVKNNVNYLVQSVPKLEMIAMLASEGRLSPADAKIFKQLLVDMGEISGENLDGLTRIENIVLSLRNFSRLDEADYKLADLSEGLSSTIKLIQTTCGTRIKLDLNLEPLPLTLCHPGELNQVFMNLLMNAIQAIPDKGEIDLSAKAENGLIRISIKDSGVGMSADVLARLGEPFFTTKPVGEGMGLGLAISMGIVNRHHGKLFFSSKSGEGSLAIIELPVRLVME